MKVVDSRCPPWFLIFADSLFHVRASFLTFYPKKMSKVELDTNAAILGAWCGALYGTEWIPIKLLNRLQRGPFGKRHLEQLGEAMADEDGVIMVPKFSWIYSFLRNLALYPVILCMGFGHLVAKFKN